MKKQLFIRTALSVALGFLMAGCSESVPETASAEIVVNGMKCDMCVSKVEKALDGMEGLQSHSVDLEKKIASVTFETAKLKLTDIEMAIAKAGFSANDTKREAQAYEELPSCCQESETVDM